MKTFTFEDGTTFILDITYVFYPRKDQEIVNDCIVNTYLIVLELSGETYGTARHSVKYPEQWMRDDDMRKLTEAFKALPKFSSNEAQ